MSVTLELCGQSKKTGRVCDRAYRAGNNCPLIVRTSSEDLLTANVFGLLKHVPPQQWLAPVLNRALETTRFRDQPFEQLRYEFWREVPPPPHTRTAEGPTEVDVTIAFDNVVVLIEAKLGAALKARTTHDPARDQLIRLLDVAHEYAVGGQLLPREPIVLVVTPRELPAALVRRYWCPSAIARGLQHDRSPKDLPQMAKMASANFGYVTWRDLITPLITDRSLGPALKSMVLELDRYIALKQLNRYSSEASATW